MKQITINNTESEQHGASAIKHMFDRYSNVLEIHLRYRQPPNSVLCPLIREDKLRLSKFLCTHQTTWGIAVTASYLIAVVPLMLLALLSGVLELGYAPEIFKSIVSSWRVPIALLPNFFVVVIPIFYSLLFIADMRVAWKEDARTTYRGPTHISLSPLSIKLLWKGAIIVSVGAMFGWDEITFVELDLPESESDESAPTVILTIKTGRLVHTIPFRLDGFQSDEDRLIFLHHIDNHVASECKTAQFKEFLSAKDKTELLLNKLKEQTTGDSIELTEELSAPGISVQTANLAGLISDKSTIEQNAQAERIIVTPTKMEAPIPRTSNEHSANSPELIAFDRSPEDTR